LLRSAPFRPLWLCHFILPTMYRTVTFLSVLVKRVFTAEANVSETAELHSIILPPTEWPLFP